MLLNLIIKNGDMSLEYDELITTYTVSISSDVNSLVIDYQVSDGTRMEILNNDNLKEGLNYVYVVISNELEKETYTLEVYKEYVEEVIRGDDTTEVIEVSRNDMQENTTLIGISCFLCILILFIVLFHPFKS